MCRWLLAFCGFCCGYFLKLKCNLLPSSTDLLSFWLKCIFSGHAFPPLTRLCFFTLVLFFFHSDPGKIILSSRCCESGWVTDILKCVILLQSRGEETTSMLIIRREMCCCFGIWNWGNIIKEYPGIFSVFFIVGMSGLLFLVKIWHWPDE